MPLNLADKNKIYIIQRIVETKIWYTGFKVLDLLWVVR